MALSAAEHLELVDSAITAALNAQEYAIGGSQRRVQRAKLADLYAQRRQLLQEIQESSGGGGQMATLGQVDSAQ